MQNTDKNLFMISPAGRGQMLTRIVPQARLSVPEGCTVRCQIKVHKVNFKAKNNAYFQHL